MGKDIWKDLREEGDACLPVDPIDSTQVIHGVINVTDIILTPQGAFFFLLLFIYPEFSAHSVAQSSYTATSRAFCLSLPKAGMAGMKPQIWPTEMS